MDKLAFKAEVKKKLTLKKWNYADLAEATGYSQGSIWVMMSDETKLSKKAMQKFADVLEIKVE